MMLVTILFSEFSVSEHDTLLCLWCWIPNFV